MIGAIIGDTIGSIYEFDNIKTKEFELFSDGVSPTDDSILTFATADWIMHGGAAWKHYVKYRRNLPNARTTIPKVSKVRRRQPLQSSWPETAQV